MQKKQEIEKNCMKKKSAETSAKHVTTRLWLYTLRQVILSQIAA